MKKKNGFFMGFRKCLCFSPGFLLVFFFMNTGWTAQQPPPPPQQQIRFEEIEHGTVIRDNRTGLEWQRCPVGQSWTGQGCAGVAETFNWYQAIRLMALGGFRLPTISQLESLNPYDHNALPGTQMFWSSSRAAFRAEKEWSTSISYGGNDGLSNFFCARLVRSR